MTNKKTIKLTFEDIRSICGKFNTLRECVHYIYERRDGTKYRCISSQCRIWQYYKKRNAVDTELKTEQEIREHLKELDWCETQTEHPVLLSVVQGQITGLKWVLGESPKKARIEQ